MYFDTQEYTEPESSRNQSVIAMPADIHNFKKELVKEQE